MKNIILIALTAFVLTGCMVSARDKDSSVTVNDGSYHRENNDGHCPPGHHMKGWC